MGRSHGRQAGSGQQGLKESRPCSIPLVLPLCSCNCSPSSWPSLHGPSPSSRKPSPLHQVECLPLSCGLLQHLRYYLVLTGTVSFTTQPPWTPQGAAESVHLLVYTAFTEPDPDQALVELNSTQGRQARWTREAVWRPTWQGCCTDPPGLLPSPHSLLAPASAAGRRPPSRTGPGVRADCVRGSLWPDRGRSWAKVLPCS